MKPLPPIVFVRHGETDWNRAGRLQGRTEIPINEVGRAQAEQVGDHWLALHRRGLLPFGPGETPFYVSPMHRTRATAELLRRRMALPEAGYRVDARLVEIAFGQWEGLTWPEIRAREPEAAASRDADRWGFAPPGGENYAMVTSRVAEFLAGLDGPACVVAHGGVARAFLVLCGGLAPEAAAREDIGQGRILLLADGAARWLPEA